MVRVASNILRFIGSKLHGLAYRLCPPAPQPHADQLAAWYSDPGAATRRFEYDLNQESIVLDVGGYRGEWASEMFTRYACKIYICEPVKEFAYEINSRFLKNPCVSMHPFGLADVDKEEVIFVSNDGSSIYRESSNQEKITLRRASTFFSEMGFEGIDVLKINIEGGEYNLLEHLLEEGWVPRIKNIQVQFHDFVADSDERMLLIQNQLRQTHDPTYQYRYIWENWKLR